MQYLFSEAPAVYEVYLSRNTVPSKALHKATLSQYLYLSVILSDSLSWWQLFAAVMKS